MNERTATADERWVPCEACDIEVPRFLATVEPQSGGHLCDACVLVLTEMAKNGSTPTDGNP